MKPGAESRNLNYLEMYLISVSWLIRNIEGMQEIKKQNKKIR